MKKRLPFNLINTANNSHMAAINMSLTSGDLRSTKKDWQNHFRQWRSGIQKHSLSERGFLFPVCLKTLVLPWNPSTCMHFLLCKETKPRWQHFTPSPARSWDWDIWLWTKSKLLSNNAGWEGSASRNKDSIPFWSYCCETADIRAASGNPHCCLAAANCSIFSDLSLSCLEGVTMTVHGLVWIQPALLRLVLPEACSRKEWNILSANYSPNSVFTP